MLALYEAFSKWSSDLDIRTKVFIALSTSIIAILFNNFVVLVIAIGASMIYAWGGRQPWILLKSYLVMIAISVLAILFSSILVWSLEWLSQLAWFSQIISPNFAQNMRDSLGWKLLIPFLRMLVVINVLFVMTINFDNQEFIAAMQKIRLPRCIFLPMMVCCRFIPSFLTDLRQCHDSLQMRGYRFGLLSSLFSLRMLMIPFCVRTLRLADNMVMSLELRGVGQRKRSVSMREIAFSTKDYVTICLFLVILISLLFGQTFLPKDATGFLGK